MSLSREDEVRISILLKDYDTPCAEARNRSNSRFGMPALMIAVWGIVLTRAQGPKIAYYTAAAAITVLILALWWFQGFWMRLCEHRCLEVSRTIRDILGRICCRAEGGWRLDRGLTGCSPRVGESLGNRQATRNGLLNPAITANKSSRELHRCRAGCSWR